MNETPAINISPEQGGGRYRDVCEFLAEVAEREGIAIGYAAAMKIRSTLEYRKWAEKKRKGKP